MHEQLGNTAHGRERSIQNQLEEVNEKIDIVRLFISLGVIDANESVPESVYERVREIARMPQVADIEIAQLLAGIEYSLNREVEHQLSYEEYEELLGEPLSELVRDLFEFDAFPLDQESVQLVIQNAYKKAVSGVPFVTALMDAVDKRKERARATPAVGGVVDMQTGVVESLRP